MCLDFRISRTNKRIKNPIVGKKYIICYSKAQKHGDNYYPLFCNKYNPYINGWNESFRKRTERTFFSDYIEKYVPHFHRFRHLKDARKYVWGAVILKWLVPTDSITTVGLQHDKVVVITNKCKLLGEVK